MRKHDRNCHAHPLGSDRVMQTPEPPVITRAAALRALGEVVYAVRCGDVVKIGHTRDLARRCRELRATEVLAFAPGTYDDEQSIHARLTDHVENGREWYYPTPGVMRVVNELRERIGLAPVA